MTGLGGRGTWERGGGGGVSLMDSGLVAVGVAGREVSIAVVSGRVEDDVRRCGDRVLGFEFSWGEPARDRLPEVLLPSLSSLSCDLRGAEGREREEEGEECFLAFFAMLRKRRG